MTIARTVRRRRFVASLIPRFNIGPLHNSPGSIALAVKWFGWLFVWAMIDPVPAELLSEKRQRVSGGEQW